MARAIQMRPKLIAELRIVAAEIAAETLANMGAIFGFFRLSRDEIIIVLMP